MEITKPTSQSSEVLYLLLEGKKTTMDFFKNGIMNPTARISDLRSLGVQIICDKVDHVNKFGRKINYGQFTILNTTESLEIYKKIN
jgi:hypothetical protein